MKNSDVVRLFDLYANDLFRFAISYMGSKQDAEDVVQDVFVKLLSKTVFLKPDYEKAYLMKMTVNGCKNLLKSPAHKTGVDLESASDELACFYDLTDGDKEVYDILMKRILEKILPDFIETVVFAGQIIRHEIHPFLGGQQSQIVPFLRCFKAGLRLVLNAEAALVIELDSNCPALRVHDGDFRSIQQLTDFVCDVERVLDVVLHVLQFLRDLGRLNHVLLREFRAVDRDLIPFGNRVHVVGRVQIVAVDVDHIHKNLGID